jgi:hypothetical protein
MRTVSAKKDEASQTRYPEPGYATTHRLTVLAGNSADAVAHAGGLIFDRTGAGWDVGIHLTTHEPDDIRALRILGVRKLLRTMDFAPAEWPDVLIVAADVYSGDAQARRIFTAATRRQRTEVAMWGGEWPANLAPGIGPLEHRLSTAARAFKAHALGAAGLVPAADDAEQFQCGQHRFDVAAPLLPPA